MIKKRKVKAKDFKDALKIASEKKGDDLPLGKVRLGKFKEGLCVQATHVGPNGRHHEIYLSDPRRTVPTKMKTLLRHPVAKKR